MFDTVSALVTKLRVKYRQWRLPEHGVHRATESLFDEAIADLEKNGEVCLNDFSYTATTKADARKTFCELESKGFLASVEGKQDTWKAGELFEVMTTDIS